MQTSSIKIFICLFILFQGNILIAQSTKKSIGDSETKLLEKIFANMAASDQQYRSPLSIGTLDPVILAKIDSVGNHHGIAARIAYEKSLNLSIPKNIADSLWALQHEIDLQNHLTLKGIFETYGYISEEIVKENNYVQILLLVHPPMDWKVETYLKEYTTLLKPEVMAGRMPAKIFANFYDNMKAKILREPQLYGTNKQYDPATQTILPPIIKNIEESNLARIEIGLPTLKEGEYRLLSE